jgi:endonuclease YncB( thermonuclease family)
MRPVLTWTVLLSTLLLQVASAESFTGKVVGVTDGDTVAVMRDGAAVKVRLHGVDAPESKQAFGARAKQACSSLCFGQEVNVEIRDVDRYGRLVGAVYLPDGTYLNQALVAQGMAWWYERYTPGDRVLASAQEAAKQNRVGLWSEADPMPPWEFRRGAPQKAPASRSEGSASGSATQADPIPSGGEGTTGESVFVTRTGQKYHREGCPSLSKSKIPMSLQEARQRYGPCGNCNPPR